MRKRKLKICIKSYLNYQLEDFELIGHLGWHYWILKKQKFDSWELKNFYLQEVKCILTGGSHNICYSHKVKDIKHLFDVYEQFFSIAKNYIKNNNLRNFLKTEALKPIKKLKFK